MDLKTLKNTPPWDWPEDAGAALLRILRDPKGVPSDRLLAVQLAGDFTVLSNEMIAGLLTILSDEKESEKIRGAAAISLGPALEHADTDGFDDPGDLPIDEPTFHRTQETLRRLALDAGVPKLVRRRILEASVCAPQPWHANAVRTAYASDDPDWKLTAVFCMQHIRGFDDQILESLNSKDPNVHYQAVRAAGNWELAAAWPHVAALVASAKTKKPLLLAAIDAAASIRPDQAADILDDLLDSHDEDIVEAVHDALAMAEVDWDEDDDEEDEFDDEEDDDVDYEDEDDDIEDEDEEVDDDNEADEDDKDD